MKQKRTSTTPGFAAFFGLDAKAESRVAAKGRVLRFLLEVENVMKKTGTSRAALAERLGVHRRQITRWLSGDAGVNADTMWLLASALGYELKVVWSVDESSDHYLAPVTLLSEVRARAASDAPSSKPFASVA